MTAIQEHVDAAGRRRTALLSVVAAGFLVAVKLAAGLITGSLGLLAEAAHSATDLIAALLTLFAVRVAVRPADEEHHYGHGKAEHLAALAESAALALVSVLIGYESLRRLLGSGGGEVHAAWWSIALLGIVIAVDLSRTLVSARAARRYESPALAANAVHFASDLAGSLAVLVGLILVALGTPGADAVAALFVGVLVVIAALRLARRSIDVLMDRASTEAEHAVRAALAPLDVEVRRVRVRHSAGYDFVDLVVAVPADAGVVQAHAIADAIEEAVRAALGRADVVVHVEPRNPEGSLRERATAAALAVPDVREVHNVRVIHTGGAYELSLHVKLPPGLALRDAHDVVARLEAAVRAAVPELRDVHTHIEPLAETDWASEPSRGEVADQHAVVEQVVRRFTGGAPTSIRFRDGERGRVALVTITLPPDQPLSAAHHQASEIEEAVRERSPELVDVIVHTQPEGAHERPAAAEDRPAAPDPG
jgi:cation diffusion facilitator family transporter